MKWTLGVKLYTGFLGLVLLLCVVTAVNFRGMSTVSTTYADITGRLDRIVAEAIQLQSQLETQGRTVLGYLATADPAYSAEFAKAHDAAEATLDSLKERVETPDGQALLERIAQGSERYSTGALALFARSTFSQEERNAAIAKLQADRSEAATAAAELVALASEIAADGAERARDAAQRSRQTALITAIAAVLIAMGTAFGLTRGITRPVLHLKQQLAALAAGGGDLTIRLAVTSGDEVGDLVRIFNQFLESMRTLLLEVRESSSQVGASAHELSGSTSQVAQASQSVAVAITQVAEGSTEQGQLVADTSAVVTQLRSAIAQIAAGATDQASSVQQTADRVTSMVIAMEDVSQKAEEVAASSHTASAQAREGQQVVQATVVGMERIRQAVQQAAEQMEHLHDLSERIGSITETITEIADQTNLLALNAAIEAARAGEHGRGFAVVADEVRKLAERAGHSAMEITGLIKDVQQTAGQAVRATEEGRLQAVEGSGLATRAGKALEEILGRVEQTNGDAEAIRQAAAAITDSSRRVREMVESVAAVTEENTAATEQMAAGSDQVTGAIGQIQHVTSRDAALAEEVASSVEEMSASAEEMAASAQSLATIANQLQARVHGFKL